MSRKARRISELGLYHVIFRGMNHCHLFEDDTDYLKFLEMLSELKGKMKFEIYSYCLMSNHVHIFLHEKEAGSLITLMRKLLTRYAGWFNRKYQRSGSLIANRYKSEVVNKDEYVFELVRYIHQNPIRAGMVEKLKNYRWSSYLDYLRYKEEDITDVGFLLDMMSKSQIDALKIFEKLHNEQEKQVFVINEGKRKSDEEVRRVVMQEINGIEPHKIGEMPRNERNIVLAKLKGKRLSIRQIERCTGISRGIISKC